MGLGYDLYKMDSRHFVSTISNYHRLFQPHKVETTFLCFPPLKHEDSLLSKKKRIPLNSMFCTTPTDQRP